MSTTPATRNNISASDQLLSTLWQRNLPRLRERLAQLEDAAAAPVLSARARTDAASTAHKLAGSLGMFGFPEGTRIARDLEAALESAAPSTKLLPLTAKLRKALSL